MDVKNLIRKLALVALVAGVAVFGYFEYQE